MKRVVVGPPPIIFTHSGSARFILPFVDYVDLKTVRNYETGCSTTSTFIHSRRDRFIIPYHFTVYMYI